MTNYFFTSDSHFSHFNILKYSGRPFSSIEEMNEKLIQNWNEIIHPNDIVYHLGDFCMDGNPQKYLKRLNGKITVLKGSHDKENWPTLLEVYPDGLKDEFGNKRPIVLCHYAMRSWPKSHYASWHLYGHCFDLQTEVLTKDGWKKRCEINQLDEIVTLNLENNLLEYNNIEEIIDFNFTGNSINILSKGLDLNLTPNHILLEQKVWQTSEKYRKYFAEDVDKTKKRTFIKSGYLNQIGIELSDDLLRLLVWIAADGNLANSSLIRIQLYKLRKIERLENLLIRLNVPYRKYPTNKGGAYFNFTRPKEFNNYSLKPLDKKLRYCNEEQTEIILQEYAETDGHKCDDIIAIWTSKKEEADILQQMCVVNGYQCNSNERNGHGFSKKPNYCLIITKGILRTVGDIASKTSRIYVENMPYWCLKVKNSTLLIRRNGKPIIVGNSHGKLESYGLSMDVGVDCNNYYPFSLDEVIQKMKTLKPIVDYRK